MTNEEAVKHFEGKTSYSNRDDFEMGDSEAKYLALSALREQAEIVKCKNCIYQKDAKVNCKGFIICPASNMEITDDDYCSYGKRRESEVSE